MRHVPNECTARAPVQLEVRTNGAQRDVLLVEKFADGESRPLQLVYDTNVFRSNQEARKAFEQMQVGNPMPTGGCGHHRVLCPYDGLPTELVRLDVSTPSEPRIHFRGRVYVSDETYDKVRLQVAPTLQERVKFSTSSGNNNTASLSGDAFSYAEVLRVENKLPAPKQIEARFGRGGGCGGRGWGGGGWVGPAVGAGLLTGAALAPWYYGYPGYAYGYR